jgi:hypothetical protein
MSIKLCKLLDCASTSRRGVRKSDINTVSKKVRVALGLTISLVGIANSSLFNLGDILHILLTVSFPTTQFPKLILFKEPPNAFNMSSTYESGIFRCLFASWMVREWKGGEEGRRMSIRRRDKQRSSCAQWDWEG